MNGTEELGLEVMKLQAEIAAKDAEIAALKEWNAKLYKNLNEAEIHINEEMWPRVKKRVIKVLSDYEDAFLNNKGSK